MAKLLPFRRSDRAMKPREPRLVDLSESAADDVFAALSAETARDILGRLYDEPGTATDVAEAADTSLQNARYHLEKLQAAGLVEAVDTWYSSRGTEMTVYAPTCEPLVVAAGPEEQTSIIRSALSRLVGALAVLGIASLLVDRLARFGLAGLLPGAGAAGDAGGPATPETGRLLAQEATRTVSQAGGAANATATPTSTGTPTASADTAASPPPTTVSEVVATADSGVFDLAGGLPPGLLFFLGGLVVLVAVGGWWYYRSYRPLYG